MEQRNLSLFSMADELSDSDTSTSSSPKDFDESFELFNSPFISRALDALTFTIEYDGRSKSFRPTMAHQIFGQDELINGYRNLNIQVRLSPGAFHAHFRILFDEKLDNPEKGEIADDLEEKLGEWFPHMTSGYEEFRRLKMSDNLSTFYGTILSRSTEAIDGEIMKTMISVADLSNRSVIDFHKRFQALIVFFIDAASPIDFNDNNWRVFYLYKQINDDEDIKTAKFVPIGFSTVYFFPASSRVRIAQMFILPNFQMKGFGSKMLRSIYDYYKTKPEIEYISVESPCEEFTIMRDKVDLKTLFQLDEFKRERIMEGYSPAMEIVAKDLLKICPAQVKHIYNILFYYYSRGNEETQNQFVIYIKREFYLKYKRKFSRALANKKRGEKISLIKQILREDFLLNRNIHRDVKQFVRSIQPQILLLQRLMD